MEKLFLTSNEVADLLNISQQQAYKIIRDMNKQLAEHGFLVLRGRINKKYFMEISPSCHSRLESRVILLFDQ